MVKRSRRATTHSHIGGRSPGGQGELARTAPRWSYEAARGARAVVSRWPTGQVWAMLARMPEDGSLWAAIQGELRKEISCTADYHVAVDVFHYHRCRLSILPSPTTGNERWHACASFTRTLNHRSNGLLSVAEALPLPILSPRGAVDGWRSQDPSSDRHRDPESCVATRNAVAAWSIGHLDGALAPQRARRRMANECQRVRERTPQEFGPNVVHFSSLPTLTANSYDGWMWADGRWFSVEETARACGVAPESPLHRAIGSTGGLTAIQAAIALGDGVHIRTARHVVDLARQGLADPTEARPFTYASAFSGIDGVAAALHESLDGAPLHYAFAAEKASNNRTALLAAWGPLGLQPGSVHEDARLYRGLELPRVDLFVCTPECKSFSRNNSNASRSEQATSLDDLHCALHYVRRYKPLRVIVENVTTPAVVTSVGSILGDLAGYDFVRHELCPHLHFQVPTSRLRSYWVGVLRSP